MQKYVLIVEVEEPEQFENPQVKSALIKFQGYCKNGFIADTFVTAKIVSINRENQ